jgi:hypothetical protein
MLLQKRLREILDHETRFGRRPCRRCERVSLDDGDLVTAWDILDHILELLDSDSSPPDIMTDGPEKDALRVDVEWLISAGDRGLPDRAPRNAAAVFESARCTDVDRKNPSRIRRHRYTPSIYFS